MGLTLLFLPLEVGAEIDTLHRVDRMASLGRRPLRDVGLDVREPVGGWEINPRFELAPPTVAVSWERRNRTPSPRRNETRRRSGEVHVGAQDNRGMAVARVSQNKPGGDQLGIQGSLENTFLFRLGAECGFFDEGPRGYPLPSKWVI